MLKLKPPMDEVARLQALRDLAILDTAAEAGFDELTRTAALVCQVPIAFISLVDDQRQWFKSRYGIEVSESPRALALCAQAIEQPEELLEVEDASQDPRFSAHPLVTGAPRLRFYAGAPLVDSAGHALGTLCVCDRQPRTLQPWQREVLGTLARQVMRLLEARATTCLAGVPPQKSTGASLQTLMQNVPTGAVLVHLDGRIEINESASAIIGYTAAEIPDLDTWFRRLYGDQQVQVRGFYTQDRNNGFPRPRTLWLRHRDGSRRQVEFHGIHSPRGELWLLREVTSSSGAEERFRVLFEQSSDAHLLFGDEGIIDCNQATLTMLGGVERSAVIGLHPARLSPEFQPDGRRSDEKCIEMDRLARERGHHRFEWQHRRLDGSDFPVEVTFTPVQLCGQPVLLVVWHDLTERKAAERAERERERRWLLALEAAGDGVWDWDIERHRVYFSSRSKAMLGYAPEDIGESEEESSRRVHPDDLERTRLDVQQHLAGETAQYVNEHRALCKDGSWKWILARGMVVDRFADGRAKRMIGTYSDLSERRHMEDRLRLEQERFRAMNDAAPIGIFVTDVAGRATYLNERWCALTGIPAAAALGEGWSATLHPEDRDRVFTAWTAAISTGSTFDAEYRFQRGDGTIVWCHGMAAPMRIAGQVVGYVGSIADISERHQSELSLRDSVHRFDLVAAGAAIGIWETRFDPARWQEQITNELPFYWSPQFIEIMGFAPDEFPARLEPWLTALHPDDHERTIAAVVDCLANGVPYNVEYRLRHKCGEYRWYHATGEADRDTQGRPHRMAGGMSDITARKRDEELLERTRSQLVDAIGSIDAGFAMFSADGSLLISNRRFLELYGLEDMELRPGYPYEAILTMMVSAGALHGTGIDEAAWIAESLAAHAQPGMDRELNRAGRWIRISDRRTAGGGTVTLHTDVTVLKQATEEMRQARDLAEGAVRAKANFLATMSHELRTPMNGVIGMSSLLLDTPLNEQQREFADTVHACGEQLLALINDVLDFSKIEAGSLVLERIAFSPRKLAEDCIALLADQADRKGLQLICLIGADVPARLLGDPTRLRQILLNLLGNAVKFTERGEVVLSLTRPRSATATMEAAEPALLEVAVRDTGIGIPVQARQRLFKAFSQADDTTTRKYGGTGLGLVICQRLVQCMGGTIELESQPGQGSTFTCRIALEVPPEVTSDPLPNGLVGQRVLVVASSAAARRSLREQFIGWGMRCHEVGDAASAHQTAVRNRPALMVIDHDLPGGGLELGRSLAADPVLRGVPQVLLVGVAHRGMASTAKAAGIAGFLTKPVRHGQLFECLLVVLQQSNRLRLSGQAAPLVTRHSLEEERIARRVLVVEDNPVNRQVAVMMLSKLGCHCDIAVHGQEAVEATARQDYHLVFMDCQMPVLDGLAATAQIRTREKSHDANHGGNRRLRIVALTANAMPEDRERCLAAGMDDYVTKPITKDALQAALARADQARMEQPSRPTVTVAAASLETVAEQVIDDDTLRLLVKATDVETVRAVAEMMRDDAHTALAELQAASAAGDAVALGRTAHRLKGSSGTLGLCQVQALCLRLEQTSRSCQMVGVPDLLNALEQTVNQALAALAVHPLVCGA